MPDIVVGSRGITSGWTEDFARNKNLTAVAAARVAADGSRPLIITHVRGAVSGRGGARTVRIFFGGADKVISVDAASEAQDTGWVDVPNYAINDHGSDLRFGYDQMSGACYFGRSSTSGAENVEGAFDDFTGSLGFAYRFAQSPVAPSILSVVPSEDGTKATVTLKAPTDNGGSSITGYRIQRSADPAFATGVATVTSSGVTVFSNLTPGSKWHYRATARNGVTDGSDELGGAWSATKSATQPRPGVGRIRNADDTAFLTVAGKIRNSTNTAWLDAEGRIRNADNTGWVKLGS